MSEGQQVASQRRFVIWPHLPLTVAGAIATELVRGLGFFLGPGQLFINGQPIGKFEYLFQNLDRLAIGSAVLGAPFGILAWLVMSLALPRDRWWRDAAIILVIVAAWNAVVIPFAYRIPDLLLLLGPYIGFAVAVLLCRYVRSNSKSPDLSISSASADRGSKVEPDVMCAQCGYNLRTLEAHGNCPECGLGILETFRRIHQRMQASRGQHGFFNFLPITFAFVFGIAIITLFTIDLSLRFRSTYPLREGLWGNKWLLFVLYSTAIHYGLGAVLSWPFLWVCLRRKRLLPSLGFMFSSVAVSAVLTADAECLPYVPLVVLLASAAICALSGFFDQTVSAQGRSSHLSA